MTTYKTYLKNLYEHIVTYYKSRPRYISASCYYNAITNVTEQCIDDLVTEYNKQLSNKSNKRLKQDKPKKTNICIIGIIRGGSIAATALHYKLEAAFGKGFDISLQLCSIKTRDLDASTSNEEELTKLKTYMANKTWDRVYIVDDLFDTGQTLKILHSNLKSEKWYSKCMYAFVFLKGDLNKSDYRFLQATELRTSVLSKIIVGLDINSNKWFQFWYE